MGAYKAIREDTTCNYFRISHKLNQKKTHKTSRKVRGEESVFWNILWFVRSLFKFMFYLFPLNINKTLVFGNNYNLCEMRHLIYRFQNKKPSVL
jgi:hypothetical protein